MTCFYDPTQTAWRIRVTSQLKQMSRVVFMVPEVRTNRTLVVLLSLLSCFAPVSDSLHTLTCFMFNSSHASLRAEENLINTSNNIITSKYVHAQHAVIRKCVFITTAVFYIICFPKIFTRDIFTTTTANKNTITSKHWDSSQL